MSSPATGPGGLVAGALVASGVSKAFGSLVVLRDLHLAVGAGQTLALLGPSGCGKSTLLRVLAGFESCDDGQVCLDGDPVRGPSPQRGMVAQSSALFPWLSVADNIAFGPRERGQGNVEALVQDMLGVTGLTEFGAALPRQLSGGMRQRAAFAQVLINTRPVLLLDEPFAALDAQTRLRLHEWVRALLRERPTTTVLVTHDVDEALLLGDHLGLLTHRPSRAHRTIAVPFGPDRGRATLTEPGFVLLKREVLDVVLSA